MAQLAVSVAGATLGFVVGGPAGAQWGWMAGSLLGAVLFPPHVEGPHLADLRVQNSAYGQPIPILYGVFRLAGNILWAAPPVEHSQTTSGKGGPTSTTYTYSESFAVGLCEGPIGGVRRIWANGKLIYDFSASASAASVSASAQIAASIRVYTGSETQLADPTMESVLGVGHVPAYRGLAYVVFTDFDLSPYGNYLPAFSFEVIAQTTSSTWAQQTLATWSYVTSQGTFFSAPYLNPSSTPVIAWGYYMGFEGVRQATLTAYGASTDGTMVGGSPGSFPARGASDSAGALMIGNASNMAWFDGPSGTLTQLPIPQLPFGAPGPSFYKEGNVIWASGVYGVSAYKLYRCEIGSMTLTQTSTSGAWTVLGASSSYVYVADYNTGDVYRFDKTTLALVGSKSTGASGMLLGDVLDDTTIYVAINGVGVSKLDWATGTLSTLFLFPGYFAPHSMRVLSETSVLYTVINASESISLYIAHAALPIEGAALSSIVSDVCTRAGLLSAQIDVTQLTDIVQGFALTNRSAAKSNLQPLMAAYCFDACDTNAKLKFVKRGAASALTIAADDLGASGSRTAEESANPLIGIRSQESDLPQILEMTYLGAENDYDNATQRAIRAVTRSLQKQTLQLPIVLRADEARARAEVMLWSQWMARTSYTFSTTLAYLRCEPSDVVTVIDPDTSESHLVRLTRCESNGKGQLLWSAMAEDPTLYNLTTPMVGGTAAGYATPTVRYAGPTKLLVIDAPPLRDTDTTQALYLGVCGYDTSWPGAEIALSRDGVTFAAVTTLTQAATIGYTQTTLGNFTGGHTVDETNAVTVTLVSGALAGTDQSGLLNGVNAALIGRELVYFRDATLTAASTYRLSGLLRARQGTEWAMGAHTGAEPFVLLTPSSLYRLPLQISDLNTSMKFIATTLGQSVSFNGAVSVTVSEACVRPLAPSAFIAIAGSSVSSNDITLTWVRRARVNAAWLNGTDVPLDESTESYAVQVLNGATVVRTVTVSAAQSWIYATAAISADGFTAGQTIGFTVSQNSDQGVLGHAASASLVR